MVEITGQNAEHFQLPPAVAEDDDRHTSNQKRPGNQVVRRIRIESDGREAQQEPGASNQLRVVFERVPDHHGDDGQQ